MVKQQNFLLYRIYYGEDIVYLGRTKQRLQDRIHGHLFKKPMMRNINIELVSRIEYAVFLSEADMNVYEVYYINLYRPALNRDDKARDSLTISLPEVQWELFTTKLWEKWRQQIASNDIKDALEQKRKAEFGEERHRMRVKLRQNEITEEEYFDFLDSY